MKKYAGLFITCSILMLSSCMEHKTIQLPAANATKTALPDNSIYQAQQQWQNQDGEPFSLDTLRGKKTIITMVFTSCGYACPRMVENLKAIEEKLPAAKRNQVRFVLVSFDTEYDTPEVLKSYAQQHQLGSNWTLLNGSAAAVKELAMLLDIRYQQLNSGGFSHNNKKILLDENGVLLYTEDGLDNSEAAILDKL